MEERKRDMSLFFALLILYSIGSLAFLPAYKISIFPFPYIAAILTVLILAYGVIKHGLFNIRVITAELLTFAIWVFLFVRMLFSENLREWLINGSLLVLVIFFGVILIRSVLREVRQREKIQELSKYKSELLSIVAHQIKNPLVAIRGYTTLVKDKTISDAGMTGEVILKIKAAAGKLIDLLNNLLDLDHLEEGKMNYEFADIEMNKFLKEIVDDFQFAAKQKNLEISFEPLPPDIHIKGDSYKLSQVFRNLIDNAIKYTEKGRVRINIKTSDAQKFALITVSDSGLGMSSELIGKLFQKFSRRAGEKLVGSGLGLYISKEIVEAHNGKIWAESEGEGKGSGFYVKLPLAPSFK
jgi:signal transduction histidine kinase